MAATSVGLSLTGLEPLPQHLTAPTWVVLVGQPNSHVNQRTEATTAITLWLNHALYETLRVANSPHRLVTICSGTLLAARAGLLDGRCCTTHHELLDALRALAPQAQVTGNRVFLVDGPLASSAGITAGIDLALHLIAEDCGEALAAAVAKDMVVYLRRSARDPELSPFLIHRRHLHAAVHRVQDAISAEPERDWSMESLASVGHVTGRHLLRLFMDNAGVSPLHYLQAIRLERARQSLEHGSKRDAGGRGRGLSVGAASASRVGTTVGWVASRRVARAGPRDRFPGEGRGLIQRARLAAENWVPAFAREDQCPTPSPPRKRGAQWRWGFFERRWVPAFAGNDGSVAVQASSGH